MGIREINRLIKNRNQLTEIKRTELAQAIIDNPKAREIAMRGALVNNNQALLWALMTNTAKLKSNATHTKAN